MEDTVESSNEPTPNLNFEAPRRGRGAFNRGARGSRGSRGARGARGARGGRGGGQRFSQPNRNQQENTPDEDAPTDEPQEGGHRQEGGYRHEGGPRGRFSKHFMDRHEFMISQFGGQPTYELPPLDLTEKKFANSNRIFVSNLNSETTVEELEEFFKPYGEVAEPFVNTSKNFAFVKLDYHENAVKAWKALDGTVWKERTVRVKISPGPCSIKVKNLVGAVTGELLYQAFSIFGEIENVIVLMDEKGKSRKEGIIDFAKKGSAMAAVNKCEEKCYFLTHSLRPVIVEPYEAIDNSVGFMDKHCNSKRNYEFQQERSVGPRIVEVDSFQHEYGTRWKSLFELFKQKEEALRMEFNLEMEKLGAQMQFAHYQHETERLREELRVREMDSERQKMEWEEREREVEQVRARNEAQIRRTEEEIGGKLKRQFEEMNRQQQEIDPDQEYNSPDLTRNNNNFGNRRGRGGNWKAMGGDQPWQRRDSSQNQGFQTKRRRF